MVARSNRAGSAMTKPRLRRICGVAGLLTWRCHASSSGALHMHHTRGFDDVLVAVSRFFYSPRLRRFGIGLRVGWVFPGRAGDSPAAGQRRTPNHERRTDLLARCGSTPNAARRTPNRGNHALHGGSARIINSWSLKPAVVRPGRSRAKGLGRDGPKWNSTVRAKCASESMELLAHHQRCQ